jgi:hypothetical protein
MSRDERKEIRFEVIMDMMVNNAWRGIEPPKFLVVLPLPPFERDEQPVLDLLYWIECQLDRSKSYPIQSCSSFEYVLHNEYFAVWDFQYSKKIGFGFVSDHLATLFKMFHE